MAVVNEGFYRGESFAG